MNIESIKKNLKEKGLRDSKIRNQILTIFDKTKVPLSVTEIAEKTEKRIGRKPNKTTVYREMDVLYRNNFIIEVELKDGKKRYEALNEHDHHHHIVCVKCKKISDFSMQNDLDHLQKEIENLTNYKVSNHSLEFFGFCNKCK